MFHGHLDYFQKPLLVGRTNTRPGGDHGTPDAHNRRFILFYHTWGLTWTNIHWNSIWLRAWSPMASKFTLNLRVHDHTTWFWRCVGTALRHFVLGSHNAMVTALGLCVKWPEHKTHRRPWHSKRSQLFNSFHFITLDDPHEYKFIKIAFCCGPNPIITSHYTWGVRSWRPATTLPDFWGMVGRPSLVIGEIFGHNWLRSKCLQVPPVTCSHPPVFHY